MKKIVRNILVAVGIGNTIYLALGVVFADAEVRKSILSILVMSVIIGLASSIYEVEKLNLLVKTMIQLMAGLGAFLAVAAFNRWFPFRLSVVISAVMIFLFFFFICWTIFYLMEKKEINAINYSLDNRKE